jgi:NAD(P)-dependent dehydrogenase (short-subunit alcohol dehydrogenase family)
MAPHIHLEGKVALVNGASRGIGEAIARVFAGAGAKVAISSRKEEGIHAAAERIRAAAPNAEIEPVVCHTGKSEQVEAALERVVERFGRLDVLVNNAATNPHFGPLVTADRRAFDKTVEVNLWGYLDFATRSARYFAANEIAGSIVNLSSVTALRGAIAQGVYGTTKAGIISMTRTLAVELGPSNIRVNAIAPGLVETKLAAAIVQNPTFADPILARTPLRRFAQPDEIAGAALFLASDAASYVTGHVLVVDGGLIQSAFAEVG